MPRLRVRLRHTAPHSAPITQSKLNISRQAKHASQQAKLYNALFNTDDNACIENAEGDVFRIYSSDDNTRQTVVDNAVKDCKQYGVKKSNATCSDSYKVWDSSDGDKTCGYFDTDARETVPQVQQVDGNTQVSVNICGNPTKPTFQDTQTCIVNSAQNTCAQTVPQPPIPKGTMIGLSVLAGIGGLLILSIGIVCCAQRSTCCRSRSTRNEVRALIPKPNVPPTAASNKAAPL